MKHGFMLIELIVSTLIASMVAGILLTALAQGTRFQTAVDNTVDTSLRIGIVSNQLEKDLMGAFVPTQAETIKKEEGEDQDEEAPAAETNKPDAKKPDEKKSDEKKGEKKEKPKPIEKIFYATNKEGNLDTLTFITNNPLVVFVGKDVGVVKPKIVRVQYTLKPEADKPHSYALHRQESNELDLAQYKNVRSYEVIGGIKSLSINYTARVEKKLEAAKAAEAQKEQKKSYEYKTSKDWVSERKKEGDKDKEQEFPRIPYSVEIKIELWDRQDKQEKEFTVVCEIPVNSISNSAKASKDRSSDRPAQPETGKQKPDDAKGKYETGPQVTHNNRNNQPTAVQINDLETLAKALEDVAKMLMQRS